MSFVIYKYPLNLTAKQTIKIPRRAKFLCVQMQEQHMINMSDSRLVLWALVQPDAPKEDTEICIYGTGNPIHEYPGEYISTVKDGHLVWHVFHN